MSTNGITLRDYTSWVQSVNTSMSTTFADFVHSMKHVGEEVRIGAITEAIAEKRVADFFHNQYLDYESSARAYAQSAANTGNARAAELWNRYASTFSGIAGEREILGDAAWNRGNARLDVATELRALGGTLAKGAAVAGFAIELAQMVEAGAAGDWDRVGQVSSGLAGATLLGEGGLLIGVALVAPVSIGGVVIVGAIAAGFGLFGHSLGVSFWDSFINISPLTATTFTQATTISPIRRDPLILDLNNNGLDTTGIDLANPILFDHDADSIKTATGWIKATDAFLVIDRNNNGVIDNGTELFGDATPLYAGGLATDGFAALAQEDTNSDGQVDNLDARFADLRLWTDLNQDGVSQSNELFTLAEKGIAALLVAKAENSILLANGNQIADLGGFIRSDGSGGTLGAAEQLADVDLASNPFYSEFTDTIPLSETAQALPDMNGAGQVRSLRQAASLQTAEGAALAAQLAAYAAETTRSGQMVRLDSLIKAWVNTSAMATTASGAFAGVNLTLSFEGVGQGTPAYQAWLDKLSILERFNGQTFLPVPAPGASLTMDIYNTRETLLDAGYQALRESVYQALVMPVKSRCWRNGESFTVPGAANDEVFWMRRAA